MQASHTRLAPRIRMNRAVPPSRIVIVRSFAFNLYDFLLECHCAITKYISTLKL